MFSPKSRKIKITSALYVCGVAVICGWVLSEKVAKNDSAQGVGKVVFSGAESFPPSEGSSAAEMSGESHDAPPAEVKKVASETRTKPTDSASGELPAREHFGSAWKTDLQPEHAAFVKWTEEFLTATPEQRESMISQGRELAAARRLVMAEWIEHDPQRAISAALPKMVREKLPNEIISELEERVSGQGRMALLVATPQPGVPLSMPRYREASVGGKRFIAYTYGSRARTKTLPVVALHGVAIDNKLAVSDSPLRMLEPGETAAGRDVDNVCVVSGIETPVQEEAPLNVEQPTAVDAGDAINILCQPAHVGTLEDRLLREETRLSNVAADSGQGTSGVLGRPTQAWTHGNKKMLVVRVDFSDKTGTPVNSSDGQPITDQYVSDRINGVNGVNSFFTQSSYGKTSIVLGAAVAGNSPDVTNVLRLPRTAASYATTGDSGGLHSDARALAAAAGFNLANYQFIGVVFSSLSNISGSKINYGGLGDINGPHTWYNGLFSFSILAHELGHNYGLDHSNLWKVTDGNPVSPTGTTLEYSDPFDIMGSGNLIEHHYSHWNKSILQWIPDTAVTTVSTNGMYRVHRFDAQGANLSNALALKIVRNGVQDYWIGHRRATTTASMDNGAYVLWGYNQVTHGDLLDLATPGNSATDAALQVGASFNDAAAGITLTTVARGGEGNDEWIDVQVGFQPRIQFASTTVLANEQGGSAVVTVNRTNNATGTVTVNYATVASTATSPADFTATSGALTWASGDLSAKTITIPLVADSVVEGTEKFTITLSGISGGIINNGATATVDIVDPGARDITFAADFINSVVEKSLAQPDGKYISVGWFTLVQDADYVNYTRGGIMRFNSDGSLDTAFGTGGGVAGTTNPRVMDVARQPDGKLVIGGSFSTVNGISRSNIARLNADGSNDSTFNPGVGANDVVYAVLVQTDGKIVVGGAFTTINGSSKRMLARLNADGSVDSTFTPPTFGSGTGWRVESLAAQTDENIVVGGTFYFSGTPSKMSLCRVLGTTGALDPAFNGVNNGAHVSGNTSSSKTVKNILVLSTGKIMISGNFTAYNNTARGGLARLLGNGALDTSFTATSNGTVNAMCLQPDGKIIIGGTFTTYSGATANRLARITSGGATDAAFIAAGGSTAEVTDLTLQPDGRVLMSGGFGSFQGTAETSPLWRFYAGLTSLPGTIQISSSALSGVEGTTLGVSLTRTGGSGGSISICYETLVGSATLADFAPSTGIVTWADGDSSNKVINIPITADAVVDNGELFTINLGQPMVGAAPLGVVQQAMVSIQAPYMAWQSSNFTALELSDASISGDLSDADKDGCSNLMEFALSGNPKQPDAATVLPASSVATVDGSQYLSLTFRRRTPALDINYTIKTSASPAGPWASDAVLVGSPVPNGDGTETVTYRSPAPMSAGSRRFMRLHVNRTP